MKNIPFMRLFLLLVCTLATLSLLGCATPADESDIPWNRPEPWEGSPYIPGMNE